MSAVASDQYVAVVVDGGSKYGSALLWQANASGSIKLLVLMPPILIRVVIAFSTGRPLGKIKVARHGIFNVR